MQMYLNDLAMGRRVSMRRNRFFSLGARGIDFIG